MEILLNLSLRYFWSPPDLTAGSKDRALPSLCCLSGRACTLPPTLANSPRSSFPLFLAGTRPSPHFLLFLPLPPDPPFPPSSRGQYQVPGASCSSYPFRPASVELPLKHVYKDAKKRQFAIETKVFFNFFLFACLDFGPCPFFLFLSLWLLSFLKSLAGFHHIFFNTLQGVTCVVGFIWNVV